ncbi:MAG TPA: lipopolysaccharide biosynthesis protein [Patescibacteria group bacterium]|nr:lipopolysaccharide biosynthesis protein [Patescibacteria group bacterium]
MNLRQNAVIGVFWSGIQLWGGRVISFVVFAFLSRLLTPEDFGLVAMASLFLAIVQTFQDQGFGDAIVQRDEIQPEHLDTAFWTNLLISGILTLLSIAASSMIAGLFHQSELTPIIQWLSLIFVFTGLSSTQQAILRRQLAFKKLAGRSLIATLAGGVIGVALAYLGYGVWSLVAQSLVSGGIGVIVLWSVSRWRPGFRYSRKHFKDLFLFGINIIVIDFLNFLNRHTDDLLIGYFLGPTMLGYYTVAYRLLRMMTELLTSVINAVALPTFSRLQKEPERLRRAFYQAVHYTSLISFPAFIGVAIVAPELIVTLFGPQWMLSIPVMRILAFIGILHSVFYFHKSLVIALGKPSWSLGMTFLNAVSNVIAFSITVQWGIVAVAAAYVIRGYLLSPLEIWVVRKLAQINIKTYFRQFIVPVVGSMAIAAVILGLKFILVGVLGMHLQLAIYVLSGGIIYLLILQVFEPSIWPQLLKLYQLGFVTKPVS